jgi:hypothetical protein
MVFSVQNLYTRSTNGAIEVGVQDGPGQNPGDPSVRHSGTGVSRPDPVQLNHVTGSANGGGSVFGAGGGGTAAAAGAESSNTSLLVQKNSITAIASQSFHFRF